MEDVQWFWLFGLDLCYFLDDFIVQYGLFGCEFYVDFGYVVECVLFLCVVFGLMLVCVWCGYVQFGIEEDVGCLDGRKCGVLQFDRVFEEFDQFKGVGLCLDVVEVYGVCLIVLFFTYGS